MLFLRGDYVLLCRSLLFSLLLIMKLTKTFEAGKRGRILLTSDLHYNHESVLHFGYGRPFPSKDDMNQWIENELQSKINSDDVFFDLGDMFWKVKDAEISRIIKGIKAKEKYKLIGNHDSYNLWKPGSPINNMFNVVADILEINVQYQGEPYKLVLSHYPLVSWNGKARGSLDIHGHTHGNIDNFNSGSTDLRVDIGWDGSLAKTLGGSPIIDVVDIIKYFKSKTKGYNTFRDYVQSKGKNL